MRPLRVTYIPRYYGKHDVIHKTGSVNYMYVAYGNAAKGGPNQAIITCTEKLVNCGCVRDRQTDTHTGSLITMLCYPIGGEVGYKYLSVTFLTRVTVVPNNEKEINEFS